MLSINGLRAWRDLYRATPAVTTDILSNIAIITANGCKSIFLSDKNTNEIKDSEQITMCVTLPIFDDEIFHACIFVGSGSGKTV